jgi:archaellum biogenesis protein FlaJ (TadC family)
MVVVVVVAAAVAVVVVAAAVVVAVVMMVVVVQFLFICVLTRQPKDQLQSEHEESTKQGNVRV